MVEATHVEDSFRQVLERKNYVLAVVLAQKLGYPESEIRHIQELALKQMACDYRNGLALRNLSKEWGFSTAEIENLLMTTLIEYENMSEKKRVGQCYDVKTGKYLTLRQWIEQFVSSMKGWK